MKSSVRATGDRVSRIRDTRLNSYYVHDFVESNATNANYNAFIRIFHRLKSTMIIGWALL